MIGRTISHYNVLEKLGGGGMGVVYKAEDTKLHRTVALKFLPTAFSFDEEAKQRFIQEAQAASALQHNNICTIHDIDETEDEQIFICMDCYNGETLKKKIEKGAIKTDEAIEIIIQIANGLQKAHEKGIVHRDIKPANIFITNDGVVKILDFGLAKLSGQTMMTKIGSTLGTIAYMSPEQLKGSEVDFRADIFSLGIVVYEMLIEHHPFSGYNEASLMYSIVNEEPEPAQNHLPGISSELLHILNRTLEKDPENRYQSMKDIVIELKRLKRDSMKESINIKSENSLKKYRKNVEEELPKKNTIHESTLTSPKTFKYAIVIIVVSLLALVLYASGLLNSYFEANKKYTSEVVVDISSGEDWNDNRISSHAVEYLIIDDLLQSSNLIAMNDSQYQNLYSDNTRSPQLRLNGELIKTNFGFELSLVFRKNSEIVKDTSLSFNEPATLLNKELKLITEEVFKFSGIKQRKRSLFTNDWEAFNNFYKGEIAWYHLDKNLAEHYFENAINIDSVFALAKLRLADVYYFERNINKSKRILSEIIPQLTFLSQVDSLKAEALMQKIAGDQRKVININSMIVEMLPGRKEALYDLGEAYFEIRDIENATEQYNKALRLDQNYTLALNHRGYCYSHLGAHQKALRDFKRYVELDSSANSFDSWGDGLMSAGKLDSAKKIKEIAIHKSPETEYFYRSLAYIQINLGEFEEAFLSINKYIELSSSNEQLSKGYFLNALNYFFQKNMDSSYYYCQLSIRTYDAFDISSRNHEAHWLLGLVSYISGNSERTQNEINQMDDLITKFRINNTNYHAILKFKLSLDYLIALSRNDMETINSIFNEFDFSIKYKVKDWFSFFDLAFFNTLFGDFLNKRPIIHWQRRDTIKL